MKHESDPGAAPAFFDRLAARLLPPKLRPLWGKYREALLYLFFGGLTTLLSIALYWLFAHPLRLPPLGANAASWVLSVAFAYVTNRTWVFGQRAAGAGPIAREAARFAAGRLATLGLEEGLLWLGINALGVNDLIVKTAVQVLVIIGNYVLSKVFVFRKGDRA